MELLIKYEFTTRWGNFPCWAKTTYHGEDFNACGNNWVAAKERLISKIIESNKPILPIPQDEVVEVPAIVAIGCCERDKLKENLCPSNG